MLECECDAGAPDAFGVAGICFIEGWGIWLVGLRKVGREGAGGGMGRTYENTVSWGREYISDFFGDDCHRSGDICLCVCVCVY